MCVCSGAAECSCVCAICRSAWVQGSSENMEGKLKFLLVVCNCNQRLGIIVFQGETFARYKD